MLVSINSNWMVHNLLPMWKVIITNLSNHIPILTTIDKKNVNVIFFSMIFSQKTEAQPHYKNIIPKYDHQYGPKALLKMQTAHTHILNN